MSNPNQNGENLNEEALLNKFKQFQENTQKIQQGKNQLNFYLNQKTAELEQSKKAALENFGTDDVSQLRVIYQNNLNHNRTVIPAALEESAVHLQRINDVLNNLGIQS